MRFCDLFHEYKIGLRENKVKSTRVKMSWVEKLLFLVLVAVVVRAIYVWQQDKIQVLKWIMMTYMLVGILVFIEPKIEEQKRLLHMELRPLSEKRIKMMIPLLKKYGIQYNDKEKLEQLIEQAVEERRKYDYLKNPAKALKGACYVLGSFMTCVVPVMLPMFSKEEALQGILLSGSTLTVHIGIAIMAIPFIKDIVYYNYRRCDDLIYDLNQLKLFYCYSSYK